MKAKDSSASSHVRIVCKIRRPQLSLDSAEQVLSRGYEYSLFSTPKEGNLVLALETPLSGDLISSSLKTSNDFAAFISVLDKTPVAYAFDTVFGECCSQEHFYNREGKILIKRMLEGVSSTVILYGSKGYFTRYRVEQGRRIYCEANARRRMAG
eukprot:TRINITY_DN14471_c0_g2_i1.p1 TRINITY_DN14471_c0_g2~~TRINITY_DN14471_c0_g2_i1.p1  ORF type:complete len:154 (-),score=18.24 TRINITY_DN14471_c0_g2_i1:248-709(-)